MENRDMDKQIRELLQEEAKGLEAPDEMKRRIDCALSAGRNSSGSIRRKRKKTVLVLAAVFVLMFASISGYAAVKRNEMRGYSNTEPDSKAFQDLEDIAEKAGYFIRGVERFSNDIYMKASMWGICRTMTQRGSPWENRISS